MSKWRVITTYDKASCPSSVLVATEHGVGEAMQHDDGAYGSWYWVNTYPTDVFGPGQIYPTHWMPLPEPPT